MAHYKVEQDDWLTVYLKYLLAVFNFFFWMGGAAVMAVGVWTLVEKSGYLGFLASSTFAASAYILIFAGTLVMVTGFLGFGAVIREDRSCLSAYFCLLLAIFLVELVAGVLAHVYYQRLSEGLKQHLTQTLAEDYRQPGAAEITASVDRLQQEMLRKQQLSRLAAQHVHPVSRGRGPPGARQLLQDRGGTLRPAGPPLQHLQGGGRLRHQAGAVPGRPPAAHGGGGHRGGLPADLRDDSHLLFAPEGPAAFILTAGLAPVFHCPSQATPLTGARIHRPGLRCQHQLAWKLPETTPTLCPAPWEPQA
ncbi:tetraspanin-11 isoform X1 [Kogia breviceps]|uniref:tetraspanin-11 isoform X1 n=2 Tax=Kogia breviceps TaxID=27615 RepID=UPI0034D328F5